MSWKERPNCKWYTSWSEKRLDRIAELGKILQNLAQSFTFLHILAQSCGGNWQYKWNTPKLMAFHFRQNSFKALDSRVAKKQCADTVNLGIFFGYVHNFFIPQIPDNLYEFVLKSYEKGSFKTNVHSVKSCQNKEKKPSSKHAK